MPGPSKLEKVVDPGVHYPQLIGRLSSPSHKMKKLSHRFWVCFELGIGVLNAPRKIFLVVSGPILKLQGLQGVGFQGKIAGQSQYTEVCN